MGFWVFFCFFGWLFLIPTLVLGNGASKQICALQQATSNMHLAWNKKINKETETKNKGMYMWTVDVTLLIQTNLIKCKIHDKTTHLSAWSARIVDTILAPLMGGLEYSGRTRILTCDMTLPASSWSLHTMVNAPARSPDKLQGHNNVY